MQNRRLPVKCLGCHAETMFVPLTQRHNRMPHAGACREITPAAGRAAERQRDRGRERNREGGKEWKESKLKPTRRGNVLGLFEQKDRTWPDVGQS